MKVPTPTEARILQSRDLAGAHPTLVFDLGGTWFRSAFVAPSGAVTRMSRKPAQTFRSDVELPAAELYAGLIDAVLQETRRRRNQARFQRVGISLGAAMDHRSGQVLGSGPLWGREMVSFDPAPLLRRAEPDLRWTVVNDVTALVIAVAADLPAATDGKITVITISSGIAARTVDIRTGRIAVDPVHGLQGEIGHLPAGPSQPPGSIVLPPIPCDCGDNGHVSSYSSGPGIERVLAHHGMRRHTREQTWAAFRCAVEVENREAIALLDAVTAPIANVLLYQMTIDPDIRHTVLVGGVIDALGDHYLASVFRNMAASGLYGFGREIHDHLNDCISICTSDRHMAFRGVGLYAQYAERFQRRA